MPGPARMLSSQPAPLRPCRRRSGARRQRASRRRAHRRARGHNARAARPARRPDSRARRPVFTSRLAAPRGQDDHLPLPRQQVPARRLDRKRPRHRTTAPPLQARRSHSVAVKHGNLKRFCASSRTAPTYGSCSNVSNAWRPRALGRHRSHQESDAARSALLDGARPIELGLPSPCPDPIENRRCDVRSRRSGDR